MPIPNLLEKLLSAPQKKDDGHDEDSIDCPACSGKGKVALSGQREKRGEQLVVPEIDCAQCEGGKIKRAQPTK